MWINRSGNARGYGAAWRKLRLIILKRDSYLCQCDQCAGGAIRLTPANEVDHIIPKAQGGTDDPSNLRAINSECHVRVTLEQQGKTYDPTATPRRDRLRALSSVEARGMRRL